MPRLTFATNNRHKIEEIRAALGNEFTLLSLEKIGCREELAEDQDTIEGNSLQKARYVFENYSEDCFADDTGLEIVALNGEPGVYSARYAGPQRNSEDNIDLVLKKLSGADNRSAQFRTVITLITKAGTHQFEGVVKGQIVTARKGAGGFGYDPVFLPDGFFKTLAEMTMEEKNQISHRGIAFQKLIAFLRHG